MIRLKELRKGSGRTQENVAAALGVTRTAVAQWERGRSTPDVDTLKRIAKLFNVTVDYLIGGEEEPNVQCVTYPIIGEVAAGYGQEAQETFTGESIEVPTSWLHGSSSNYFVLRASGDSMWPEIRSGDLLIVRRTPEVISGRLAIVVYGDGAGTVKRVEYKAGSGYIDLIPRNPEYKPVRVEGEDVNRVYVQGGVVMVVRDMERSRDADLWNSEPLGGRWGR